MDVLCLVSHDNLRRPSRVPALIPLESLSTARVRSVESLEFGDLAQPCSSEEITRIPTVKSLIKFNIIGDLNRRLPGLSQRSFRGVEIIARVGTLVSASIDA